MDLDAATKTISRAVCDLRNIPRFRPSSRGEWAVGRDTILVTGAGGSIGSHLIRHILDILGGQAVFALDNDDTALQRLCSAGQGRSPEPILCDVRDRETLTAAFRMCSPRYVIHCAALKHVDLLERFPREAVLTNVVGTTNVLRASQNYGSTVINLSSDKAASATNVLGQSKRITEGLVAQHARMHNTKSVSIRLGNVLGSRGSALEIFVQRALAGLPIEVADPGMTRYFMSYDEVLALIFFCLSVELPSGACVIPDLGSPVAIGQLVEIIGDVLARKIEISSSVPRPGDRPRETLLGPQDIVSNSIQHCGMYIVDPVQIPSETAANLSRVAIDGDLRRSLHALSLGIPERALETAWV